MGDTIVLRPEHGDDVTRYKTKLAGGTLEAGYQVGCGIELGQIKLIGSVGVSTLDVIARHPDRFEVFALTGASRVDELAAQCLRWKPRFAAMPDADPSRWVAPDALADVIGFLASPAARAVHGACLPVVGLV